MRTRFAILGLGLAALAGCGKDAPSTPVPAPVAVATDSDAAARDDATRAWLAKMLTCADRDFLRVDAPAQRARLVHMAGVTCEPAVEGQPLRCAITPLLRLGQAEIGWFVLGGAQSDIATLLLPAPPEALRTVLTSGVASQSPATSVGDTTVQCPLTDDALAPGAIAGTVQREGDPSASVRVCAFELAEGGAACAQTASGERAYRIEGLARGDYLVVAMPGDAPDARVGWTDCDSGAPAADTPCTHELEVVTVEAGRMTGDIDPGDLRNLDEAGDWPQPPPAH